MLYLKAYVKFRVTINEKLAGALEKNLQRGMITRQTEDILK